MAYKLVAVNVSDILAMGGLPEYALNSIGVPAKHRVFQLDEFYREIKKNLKKFNIKLIDYGSGYATVSVQDNTSRERFRYFASDEVTFDTELLDGYVPGSFQIRTTNFSGKLRIEFRKTL